MVRQRPLEVEERLGPSGPRPDGTDGAELVVGGERNPPTTGPSGRTGKIDA